MKWEAKMENVKFPYKIEEQKKEEQIAQLFNYRRKNGFPNYKKEDYDHKKELAKVSNFDESRILRGNDLEQTMHGCGFLWTYFPHWVDVRCGNDNSVKENWADEQKLFALIQKTYNWEIKHGNGFFTINRIRQNAKVYCSKQSVSNFRPTVAKYIYNKYGNCGIVWDMSCGFGGRLLGFLSSNCKKYIGTEPAQKTFNGLLEMKADFEYVGKEIELYQIGSECFFPEKETIDLCFTSPPYFDTEKYSEEKEQSYIKFPTKEEWVNGFLKKTLENCFFGLKNSGYLILNISNVKSFNNLEEVAIETAQNCGFVLEDTLYLVLSSIAGKGKKKEPVFVFKKAVQR